MIGSIALGVLIALAIFFGWRYMKKRKAKKRAAKQVREAAEATVERMERVESRQEKKENQGYYYSKDDGSMGGRDARCVLFFKLSFNGPFVAGRD